MPPRFMERIERQSETLKSVFGESAHNSSSPGSSARTSVALSDRSSRSSAPTFKTLPTPPPRYAQDRTSIDQPALPKDSLILVTAANSFLGIHIVDQLLERGYRVRGTVRDAEKAVWTSRYFRDKYGAGRFMTALVPDMAVGGAFDLAIRDCAGVVHVASVTSMSPDPNDVITPTIAGALNALEAAATEPSVTRFVHTSSIAAAISHDRNRRTEVSSHTWNMLDFNVAWAEPPYNEERAVAVFSSSKMQAEAAVWRWCEYRPAIISTSNKRIDQLL